MTASPVNSKGKPSKLEPKEIELGSSLPPSGSNSTEVYWRDIKKLESLMHSKVYTYASEFDLAKYIPSSTTKIRYYENMEVPCQMFEQITSSLKILYEKHEISIRNLNLLQSSKKSAIERLSKLAGTFKFCLYQLGIWLAVKAAEAYSDESNDVFTCGKPDRGEPIARQFCKDVNQVLSSYIPSDWKINHINEATVSSGLLSTKVVSLIEALSDYRHVNDMRCIIFVARVTTAIVLKSLLKELNPNLFGWKTEYTGGNKSVFQSQSRSAQNDIVEAFRKGQVNIIVATSMLEEGLDVQACNVVIRFDLPSTVCSFIQSRGRARMQNSDFLLLIRSGDTDALGKVKNYLTCDKTMRDESLIHASEPCEPLESEKLNEAVYQVESTGATLSLSSSVSMLNLYCSKLPSDKYFKPLPRFDVDKKLGTCSIYFPKSCPISSVKVSNRSKYLKQLACLEACKKLHRIGALTDNLVPDTVEKAVDTQEIEYDYVEEQVQYAPPELVGRFGADSNKLYHFYLIKLKNDSSYDVPFQDIVLGVNIELDLDKEGLSFDLEGDTGNIVVSMTYVGTSMLTSDQILLIIDFQMTVLRVLLDGSITKLIKSLDMFKSETDPMVFDYLLVPSLGLDKTPLTFDWSSVKSVQFPFQKEHICNLTSDNHQQVHIRNGDNDLRAICSCLVENSLVYTPFNGHVYCVENRINGLNGNSPMQLKGGETVLYKNLYKARYGIDLLFNEESFFAARKLFVVQNLLQGSRRCNEKETSTTRIELPSELCYVLMSPISLTTFHSFSLVPSIMHRIMSLLIAMNLKKLHLDHGQYANVPAFKVLEAITTKKCQERFHLESFETLGDSFLKYAASQQLFKTLPDQHEGVLSSRREKIISNDSLCRLGCNCNLPGFVRDESFDLKTWVVPGDRSCRLNMEEIVLSNGRQVYITRRRTIKKKVVADVVEALIGVFLCEGGEMAALSFMRKLGIRVDFNNTPYTRQLTSEPEKFINIQQLESLLKYTFSDASLLVEALTHGSYNLPEIPRCYQRLEFLGDAVLDYLITAHLYTKHPGVSSAMLTNLRSAMVNNDCYAQSSVKMELHKHILHGSLDLHRNIVSTVHNFDGLSSESTFGWEFETTFPKVLGDVIESLAGAILVDSGYDKERVFQSIRPLLEPLVTPETLKLHPVKELHDLTQKHHYEMKRSNKRKEDGTVSFTIEVDAEGHVFKESRMAKDQKMAERLASKSVLKLLKEKMTGIIKSDV